MKQRLTTHDIISNDLFLEQRPQWLQRIIALKKNRRVFVGPDMVFDFENHDTLVWQIQEMLRIEGGGTEQLHDEISAYQDLLPLHHKDYHELSATCMIEINNLERRTQCLKEWLGFDHYVFMTLTDDKQQDHKINGIPLQEIDRDSADGKTSAVHFFKFNIPHHLLGQEQKGPVILSVEHPHYHHSAVLSEAVTQELSQDLRPCGRGRSGGE